MIQNIKPINEKSKFEDIQNNFDAIQTAIDKKQLAFHYLNLYNLKGSVQGTAPDIRTAYNLLNLNEALLIVDSNASWRGLDLNIGDYLVKTTAGPLCIPGPTTGYYIPSFPGSGTQLVFTYTTEEPDDGATVTANIQGASGGGYDLIYTLAVNDAQEFPAQYRGSDLIIPIIQIYDGDTLIDYPYTLERSGTALSETYTLTITTTNQWTGKTFTVRVR